MEGSAITQTLSARDFNSGGRYHLVVSQEYELCNGIVGDLQVIFDVDFRH
jgi:hypothetical protein